jgi:LacI family transcriptional regulator
MLNVAPVGVHIRQSTDVLAIDDPAVAAALRFIREKACEPCSVEDVLQHVPLSRSSLERKFRHYIGRSLKSEIRAVQLKRVLQLLADTDLPLSRIATLAGFDHTEYLSVVFKRELGTTPGQYRARVTAGTSEAGSRREREEDRNWVEGQIRRAASAGTRPST